MKYNIPRQDPNLRFPLLLVMVITEFLPPGWISPELKIAPNLQRTLSYFLDHKSYIKVLNLSTPGSIAGVNYYKIKAFEIIAPYLTKSTVSFNIGSTIFKAS